ncbi:MAG TPA: GNAT family N-acetyltransferase [Gemmatimonadales bacterium]|jgi:GNAT superfamily N-acetyltransferase|nr:GNAT family N-acetyltransferase [Gemmatimonadales bacterium]
MWRPERGIRGPERVTLRDVDALNRVFSEAFTDRYGRDGLVGVRVPHLNPLVWRYAIEDAGDGAMLWRDGEGEIAGFNMVHRSGTEGWMGPLAVRPDRQGERLGSAMVQGGIEWLKSQGAATIGLETMPRTVDNIGFYSRLGLLPGHLTVTLVREAGRRIGALPERLGDDPSAVNARLDECRVLTDRLQPGVDFTRELALTRDLALGDTTLVRRGRRLVAFALWHSAPLAAGRPRDEVRLLKLAALDLEAFSALLDAVQAAAEGERLRRLSVRCQSAFGDAYAQLIRDGFRVHWTDLRMTLGGYPEAPVRQGIVMSNWEI